MTILELGRRMRQLLASRAGESAAFEANQLLLQVLEISREELPLRLEEEAPPAVWERCLALAQRRSQGYPLQYLLGQWEFFGLPFWVGEGVLIPRQDTEVLVEEALARLEGRTRPRVADLCCGSGCVGLAIAYHRQDARVALYDASEEALAYARRNRELLGLASAEVTRWDICQPVQRQFDMIVSNPPYIPAGELCSLPVEVLYEPRQALDGGEDGLQFYRILARAWQNCLAEEGWLLVECGCGQAGQVGGIFRQAGLVNVQTVRDLAGIERVVAAQKSGQEEPCRWKTDACRQKFSGQESCYWKED